MTGRNCIIIFAMATLCALGLTTTAGAYDRSCTDPAVIFDETQDMTEPKAVHKVDPKYPEEARKEGISGTVILDAVIDSTGAVDDVSVLEDPDPRLSAAAVDAVRQWRFEPARDKRGEPIAVCFILTVKFHLK